MASKRTKDHRYTRTEDEWLKENIANYTYEELTEKFNAEFESNLSQGSVTDHCIKSLKLHRGNTARYKAGRKPFNEKALGSETISCGYVYVKIGNIYIPDGERVSMGQNPNWKKRCYIVWESVYGEVPDGHMILHLDMDKMNDRIENLCCVSRRVNFLLSKNRWHTTDPQLTLAAIKWCEHFYARKETKDEKTKTD